eukprot:scaffold7995_cov173-Amphora_coffeaeformis.AAC.6
MHAYIGLGMKKDGGSPDGSTVVQRRSNTATHGLGWVRKPSICKPFEGRRITAYITKSTR